MSDETDALADAQFDKWVERIHGNDGLILNYQSVTELRALADACFELGKRSEHEPLCNADIDGPCDCWVGEAKVSWLSGVDQARRAQSWCGICNHPYEGKKHRHTFSRPRPDVSGVFKNLETNE